MNTGSVYTLGERVMRCHRDLRAACEHLGRVSVAVYDPATDWLRTFVESGDGSSLLQHHGARLAEVPSLAALAASGATRVVDDLARFAGSGAEHSRRLLEAGFRSSYTVPLKPSGRLVGFLFFDADRPGYFTPAVTERLGVYAQLIGALLLMELSSLGSLRGAMNLTGELISFRDSETGAHLQRMSRYARLIAQALAEQDVIDDEYAEYVFQFAPLHDVGKLAVPDSVLLKAGPLNDAEQAVMRRHVDHGLRVIEVLRREFSLNRVSHMDLLADIVGSHHENWDGSGYPAGLAGEDIPLPGRIIRVADVFDVLTSVRPWKRAWALEDAFAYLREHAGSLFDPACVAALLGQREEVVAIRTTFVESSPRLG